MEKQPEKIKVTGKLVINDPGEYRPECSPVRMVEPIVVLGVESVLYFALCCFLRLSLFLHKA